jgi:hypothetical protein
MKLLYFRNILEKTSVKNLYENFSMKAEFLDDDRQTDRRNEADSQFK